MASLTQKAFAAARARSKDFRRSSGSGQSHSSPYSGTGYSFKSYDEARYYQAFREVCYTAIRPIATRFAGQSLRVAAIPRRRRGQDRDQSYGMMTKALRSGGYLGSTFSDRQKEFRFRMPKRIKAALPENAVVLDEHEFTDTINRPNDVMDGWSTMYCVAASLLTCGKALLTWDQDAPSIGGSGDMTSSVYYIPMHWATPKHEADPFTGWTIRPVTGGEASHVERGEFVYFQMPNPSDPLNGFSPMMATGRTINTSDKITDAHQASMENLIKPSYAVVAGEVVNSQGIKGRARFKPEDRKKISNAIKSYIGGVMRAGEPIILDQLIADIKDISPKSDDIGFVQGEQMTSQRIMQAFGVSNVIAGYAENANRAGAGVAHDIFYDVVLNPLLLLSGGAFTHFIGPMFNTDAYRVVIYHEEARMEDADQKRSRSVIFKDVFSDVEKRKYVRTGEIDWTDEDVPEKKETETEGVAA